MQETQMLSGFIIMISVFCSVLNLVSAQMCSEMVFVFARIQGEIPLQGDFSAEHMIFGGE